MCRRAKPALADGYAIANKGYTRKRFFLLARPNVGGEAFQTVRAM